MRGQSDDSQRMQTPGRSGLPDCRGIEALGAGEVHPAWASVHAAPVVGAAAAGGVPGDADGASSAGPVRSALPRRIQDEGAGHSP